jgi:hypothetical protein
MNLFILIMLIPLSFADSPPSCGELGTILQDFEKELNQKTINHKNCKPEIYKELITSAPKITDPEFLSDKACQELSTIETQLEHAKLELAVLNGIEKLKDSIGDAKEDTRTSNLTDARESGMSFVSSLNTAASLETLLNTNDTDKNQTPFVAKLKAFPADQRSTEEHLKERLKELCKDRSKTEFDACNPKFFKPGTKAAEELLNLINTSEPNPRTIASWKKNLTIKKKNAAADEAGYSFNQMQAELGGAFEAIDKKTVMSKEHLKAIQRLDDFESVPDSWVDVAVIKDLASEKIASDRFFLVIGDAKTRQQYDISTRVELSDLEKANCSQAKKNFNEVQKCMSALKTALPKITDQMVKSKLEDFLPALETSVNYANKLGEKEASCLQEITTKEKLTSTCYADFNKDLASLQDKIIQLNLVKEKIGSENMELLKYRNLALQKWGAQKCGNTPTSMDMCEDESIFSKEASMTVSESMNIALIFSRSEEHKTLAEKEAEELCDAVGRKPNKVHDRLCAFFNDTTEDTLQTKNAPEKEPDSPYVSAPDGRHVQNNLKDAWIAGGVGMVNTILPFFMPKPKPLPFVNPYPSNYSPYVRGNGMMMSTADTIVFNARYYGAYGYYMPTPGYAPGTAFPTATPYTPISASGGSYFNAYR